MYVDMPSGAQMLLQLKHLWYYNVLRECIAN